MLHVGEHAFFDLADVLLDSADRDFREVGEALRELGFEIGETPNKS